MVNKTFKERKEKGEYTGPHSPRKLKKSPSQMKISKLWALPMKED